MIEIYCIANTGPTFHLLTWLHQPKEGYTVNSFPSSVIRLLTLLTSPQKPIARRILPPPTYLLPYYDRIPHYIFALYSLLTFSIVVHIREQKTSVLLNFGIQNYLFQFSRILQMARERLKIMMAKG
jgi:hypothetical protein